MEIGMHHPLAVASCLLLDLEKQEWEENVIGDLPQLRSYHAAVTVETIGTYLIGGGRVPSLHDNMTRTTDFLPAGKTHWVVGPEPPVDMYIPCAVSISELAFLVTDGKDILEYQVDINDPTSTSGWQETTKWPRLERSFWEPGCSKIDTFVVIAEGRNEKNWRFESQRSTEVLDIPTRTVVSAGNLIKPRRAFQLATITRDRQQMILAYGGYCDFMDSRMAEGKEAFGAAVLPRKDICPP